MKHNKLEIIYKYPSNVPHGIRDENGYLLFFPDITKYPDQQERYEQEVKDLFILANYLLGALKKRYANESKKHHI